MCVLALEQLVGGGVLQHLGHGAQVTPVIRVQLPSGRHVDDAEAVGGHDGRVHVAVVQQVAYNLAERTVAESLMLHSLVMPCEFLCIRSADILKRKNIPRFLPSTVHPPKRLGTFYGGCSSEL